MNEKIINTVLIVIFDLIAISLIGVCNTYSVPAIATIITVTLTCVAGWATYFVLKLWIKKLLEAWNIKRKQ